MKSNCEVCGQELGFFERSLKIENTRLGLSYQTLCSACHHTIALGVDKIEELVMAVKTELNGPLAKYRYASGDINVLIFLAVKALLTREPDYDDKDHILTKVFYPESEKRVLVRFNVITGLIYKILRSGWSPVLGRYGLDTLEAFTGYMAHNSFFLEQVKSNCGPEGETVYSDIFVNEAGLVFFDTQNFKIRSLFLSRDRTIKFEEVDGQATYDLEILRPQFSGLKIKPVIYFNRRDQRSELVEKLESYNHKKGERIEDELKALIYNLNIEIEKDLRQMHPDEELSNIPFDSVLVAAVKALFDQDLDQDYIREAPDGILSHLLKICYPENLSKAGFENVDEIQNYIADFCMFVTDFDAAYSDKQPAPAFAFLTPRAYMIEHLGKKDAFLRARNELPNDLYCNYQYLIYQGRQEFYITTASSGKNEEGYYFLTGVRIHSKNKKVLERMENYFRENALDYYKNEYNKELEKKEVLRENEIIDAARRIFVGYGYLPFCIYDEWAAVEESIKRGDILMDYLISDREPKTGTHNARIFYAGKTVNSFEQEAARLAEELKIDQLPVARALLWKYLKKEIHEVCAQEFIRLAGDIAEDDESLEDVFLKYSNLTSIQPEKSYYLGLFIYYLMHKGLFEETDFLDHYDTAARLYIKLNPNSIKTIEFSELSTPQKRGFDAESIDFSRFEVEVPTENLKEPQEDDTFLMGIKQESGDSDSVDELIKELGKGVRIETSKALGEDYVDPESLAVNVEEQADITEETEEIILEEEPKGLFSGLFNFRKRKD